MREINTLLLQYLNSFGEYKIIQELVFISSDLPIFFLPVFLVSSWFWYSWKNKNTVQKEKLIFIFYACCIGVSISLVIQQFIQFDRPETALINSGKLLLNHIPDASFPSDHATISFAFLTSLFFAGYRKVFYYFLPFVIIMNISRIIAGVHWPLDILAGFLVGCFSAYIVEIYINKLKFVKSLNSYIIKILSYIHI